MPLIAFFKRAGRRQLWLLLLLTVVAGVANTLLVLAVHAVTTVVARGERPDLLSGGLYVLAFAVYFFGNQTAMIRATRIVERLLRDLRLQLVDKLRRSELAEVNRLGRGQLYTLIAQETNHLSVTFPLMIDAAQQAILLLLSLVYLGWLSQVALAAFVIGVLVGAVVYSTIDSSFRQTRMQTAGRQARMLDAIADIIDGAKELRLNRRKSDDVFALYRRQSQSVETLMNRSGDHWADMLLLGSFVTYLILGIVVFLFPDLIDSHRLAMFQLIPVLLFCMGPLAKLVASWPMFILADVGLRSILAIDRQLSESGGLSPDDARARAPQFRDFRQIALTGATFRYRDAQGEPAFTIGPLDLTLTRGEITFLIGGNGSGKSTVARVIAGLYPLDAGTISVDGRAVSGPDIGGFRELFSAIFADFRLFDRLYGLEDVDPREVNRLIDELELGGKVRFENGRFTQLALSTGQRKRLALIAALLEDRPIYIFDEWSAEQDPRFRDYFYRRLLPDMRARGKTVVAVTHDDRYWHLADRVVKMELGRVEWSREGGELELA